MRFLGIDLGTTNSVVSEFSTPAGNDRGKLEVIKVNGYDLTPSIVSFDEPAKKVFVGMEAKAREVAFSESTIVSIKREMGNKNWKRTFFGKEYTPVEISAEILKQIKSSLQKPGQESAEYIVITVPAYFNDIERRRTKEACELAGFKVLQLLSEPTAAALAFGIHREIKNETILVYDLGGGTFDVCCLEIIGDDIRELGIKGNMHLGGDNFDDEIVTLLAHKFKEQTGIDLNDRTGKDTIKREDKRKAQQLLRQMAERTKIELSEKDQVIINVPILIKKDEVPYGMEYTLQRTEFEKLIAPYVGNTIDIAMESLKAAGKRTEDISRVFLVGGSTNIPLVRSEITRHIKTPHSLDPAKSVAYGAALYAYDLSLPHRIKIEQKTSQNLGVKASKNSNKDHFEVIVPEQTPLSNSTKSAVFTTVRDGQEKVPILIYQGSSPECSKNSYIGEMVLRGIHKAKAGTPEIEVKFEIDQNKILTVRAYDLKSKAVCEFSFDPSKPTPPPPEQIASSVKTDIVFLFDDSGSMSDEIDGLKSVCIRFANRLKKDHIDCRLGLVSFIPTCIKSFPLQSDPELFKNYLSDLHASGLTILWGDRESLDVVNAGLDLFRDKDAKKVFIVISDEPTSESGDKSSLPQILKILAKHEIITYPVAIDIPRYRETAEATGGEFFNIQGNVDFTAIIDKIGRLIADQLVVKEDSASFANK
jgi:molecular chaperone DnaK